MEKVEYLVIGSGVTGLSFANFINSNSCIVLEKESEIGGYCRTIYKDGFVWDYSGHFFHFRNPEIRSFFTQCLKEEDLVEVKKNSKILYKDRLIDYPFQKNIHQLEKHEFMECLYDLYFRDREVEYHNFKGMLYSKFGKAITEKFLVPYNEKLYACDLNELESNAMGRFFPFADITEVISNFKVKNNQSYNDIFIYPRKGAMQFVKALEAGLGSIEVCTQEALVRVDVHRRVAYTTKREISYENLISTMPFPELLQVVGLGEYTNKFSWNKVLVFNIGFDRQSLHDAHWIYVPEDLYRFYRVGFYDNILSSDRMSLYVEIGLKKNEEADMDKEYKSVMVGLREAGIISDHKTVCYESIVMDPAYVHCTDESHTVFQKLSSALRVRGIHSIGRYGGWKYCSIEDNILESRQLAEAFNQLSRG